MSAKYWVSQLWNGPSRLGDRLGWEWLTYNPGVFLEFAMVARRNAPPFAQALVEVFPEARALCDVGAGTGQFVRALRRLGREVDGFEYAALGRLYARAIGVDLHPLDFGAGPLRAGRSYDVAYSLEVGEHLPPALSETFVSSLVGLAPVVVVTCAPPGQPGHGHVNCRPMSYWQELFGRHAYAHDDEAHSGLHARLARQPRVSSFLTSNLMVFAREAGAP